MRMNISSQSFTAPARVPDDDETLRAQIREVVGVDVEEPATRADQGTYRAVRHLEAILDSEVNHVSVFHRLLAVAACAVTFAGVTAARAEYPDHPVKEVVPYS